jgi:hypothetical protein
VPRSQLGDPLKPGTAGRSGIRRCGPVSATVLLYRKWPILIDGKEPIGRSKSFEYGSDFLEFVTVVGIIAREDLSSFLEIIALVSNHLSDGVVPYSNLFFCKNTLQELEVQVVLFMSYSIGGACIIAKRRSRRSSR